MTAFIFGFMMSIGWYMGKLTLLLANNLLDRTLYKMERRKINKPTPFIE